MRSRTIHNLTIRNKTISHPKNNISLRILLKLLLLSLYILFDIYLETYFNSRIRFQSKKEDRTPPIYSIFSLRYLENYKFLRVPQDSKEANFLRGIVAFENLIYMKFRRTIYS